MTDRNVDPADDQAVFDALLTPHRSLGRQGFRLLIAALAALSALVSVPFYLIGAWPVIGFFGLDVALLYVFFRLNYRAATRPAERVLLTRVTLLFARMDRRGRWREWRFNPAWVRLSRESDEELGLMRLALVQRTREVEIARCLGGPEKADFADALAGALAQVRQGRRLA
jgi:uncharacterized membrane protein